MHCLRFSQLVLWGRYSSEIDVRVCALLSDAGLKAIGRLENHKPAECHICYTRRVI